MLAGKNGLSQLFEYQPYGDRENGFVLVLVFCEGWAQLSRAPLKHGGLPCIVPFANDEIKGLNDVDFPHWNDRSWHKYMGLFNLQHTRSCGQEL